MTEDLLVEARAEKRYEEIYAKADAEKARRQALLDNPETIQVGEGVTLATNAGGLYVPYTVIETRRNGRELLIQRDKTIQVTPGNGWTDDGEKTFERDPNGPTKTITKRNDGTYIAKGSPKEWFATRYIVGMRRDWTDYSQ